MFRNLQKYNNVMLSFKLMFYIGQIQVAHWQPVKVTVTGEGVFPRLILDLPRNRDELQEYITDIAKFGITPEANQVFSYCLRFVKISNISCQNFQCINH